ncbi:MAG: acyltransferase family protein, partial [Eubacteriales bacterium]
MKRKRIDEVYFLRSIAIMCVVTVHTVTRIIEIYGQGSILFGNQQLILMTIRLFATFGTPIFIFLSELLLAYAYSDKIPEGFLKKRFRLILIPYISMAFLYAFILMHETGSFGQDGEIFIYIKYVLENLYTGFYRHGYFIIVIFQFYFIHMLFYKKLKNISSKKLLISTFIINVAFLMFFNFNNPYDYKYGFEIWRVATWGSFPAW